GGTGRGPPAGRGGASGAKRGAGGGARPGGRGRGRPPRSGGRPPPPLSRYWSGRARGSTPPATRRETRAWTRCSGGAAPARNRPFPGPCSTDFAGAFFRWGVLIRARESLGHEPDDAEHEHDEPRPPKN